MKSFFAAGIVAVAGLALLPSAQARGGRGGGASFGGAHFSGGGHYSGGARYSGGGRSFSSGPRFNHSSVSSFRGGYYGNRGALPNGSRYTGGTRFRNPTYTSVPGRLNGNRTTAFNTGVYNRNRVNGARTTGVRNGGYNRAGGERIVARHGGNWNRHWDRGRDHYWHGRRCHWHNNVWVIYEPLFWYPYGYGYGYGYPYDYYNGGAYYDSGYSDQYATNEYSQQPADENVDGSQISAVQRALAREGYYDGAIDGQMGPATQRALRRYQRDRGLSVTGHVDRAVVDALRVR